MNELTWEDEQDIAQYHIWKIDNDWHAKGHTVMPQIIVKETTVYTLAELDENFSWSVYEKALANVKEYEWEGWEPSWYTDDITMFIKDEYPLFDLSPSTLEWGTNPNFVRAEGDIQLVAYMRYHKLCNKWRALYYALTTYNVRDYVGVSFDKGQDVDLADTADEIAWEMPGDATDRYTLIKAQLTALETDIQNYVDGIESRLLGNLSAEIDWRWSDEFAKEEAEAHEIVFTEDGDIYHG